MKTIAEVLEIARKTLTVELDGIRSLESRLTNDFYGVVNEIINLKGRTVVTGIGKSAIIAQKIVATLNSTGTPSIFMHAADAVHGDLGIIQKDDIVICISKSGNTPEIKVLLPLLKHAGNKLVGMVGNLESTLAGMADYVLDTTVDQEACPHNLAPTSSTTAQLVMGDMLAVCLLECRNFNAQDFARYHPGGALGKRMYLKVEDIYHKNQKPQVSPAAGVKEILIEITRNRLGAVTVVENGEICGIITDGDIRRMLENNDDVSSLKAREIMSLSPQTIGSEEMAVAALEKMRNRQITQLIVADDRLYKGIIHLHDLLNEGII